ncbi:MAG TPA: carboxylesterase family protein [Steroidobacteraceae bacterium]|nr:carboxylesterase family protein [Steroidobacteraceae bacterium]
MIDRRTLIGMGTMVFGSLAAGRALARLAEPKTTAHGATVETTAGKIRGKVHAGVHVYRGVPYAASTAGRARFMPPAPARPWPGVRDAYQLGHRSPQLLSAFHGVVPHEVEVMDRDEPMGEDCLVLNVWTAGPGDGGKRPVMVWLHGGGYTSGSGGFIIYDGLELARKHGVVAITINHRLTALGYLDLAGIGGERYAQSSNLGNLDIIAALEWVRDNATAFGGDPQNVTIFGQSGGGGKVSSLMAMPAAKGLFHRAIVQSGADVKGVTQEAANRSAEMFIARLGITRSDIGRLQELPVMQLINATAPSAGPPLALAPVVDGRTLPSDPFDPVAPALSANVPLLIGTVETEVAFFPHQILDPIDAASLHQHVKSLLRRASDPQVSELIEAYRRGRPRASNTDLYLIIASDATFRRGVMLEAERKAAQGAAAVYQYYFTWRSPVRGGKLRTFHTLEIPFVFDNVDAARAMTGSGADRYALAAHMSGAWTAFARSGDPSHAGLPRWAPFDLKRRATMVFNDRCELIDDPHGAEQRLLQSLEARA